MDIGALAVSLHWLFWGMWNPVFLFAEISR